MNIIKCEWCLENKPKTKVPFVCLECLPYLSLDTTPDNKSSRKCRDCNEPLSKARYFKCEACVSEAYCNDDDSIFIPYDYQLDELTEKVVGLFGPEEEKGEAENDKTS